MTAAVDLLVERLWVANRGRTHARFRDVLEVLDAIAAGQQVDPALGVRQAHALAGTLGTYRRPGSDLFKDVEQALRDPLSSAAATDLGERVRRLLTDLFG